MADSPNKGKIDLASFSITVDGTEIPKAYSVTKIQVRKELNRVPEATICLLDGDPSKNEFKISEEGPFKVGAEVAISLGYHQTNELVFKGVIIAHGLKLQTENISELVLTCVDKAAAMTVARKSKYYVAMKDSDILSEVIGAHRGLSADVKATSFTNDTGTPNVQYYASDWDFMIALAEANGLVVAVDDAKVAVADPKDAADSGIKVKHGADIVKLDLDVDARFQVGAVKTYSWDYSGNTITENSGEEVSNPSMGNDDGATLAKVLGTQDYELKSTTPLTSDVLKAWGDAYLKKNRYSRFRGRIKFQGNAKPKPNMTLALEGLGAKFNGTGYISGVVHTFVETLWHTEVMLGLDPVLFTDSTRNVISAPASGLVPGIEGLQIGVVKRIHEDPDGEYRVQVEIPIIEAGSANVWARMLKYYATGDAGNFFYPEIGDEVILSFLNNDPRYPVILGSVYSSTHVPPYTPDEENKYKAIVTRNQLKIEFDDIDLITTILTPNGNTMIFSDKEGSITIEDENKNKMVMNSAGVDWYTPGDLTIKVDGNMEVKVTGNITHEATGDLKGKGMNVTHEASVGNTMKGATAEVNGSATTTIKGGMVMIN
ncbi:MAG: type VI secretion system tip protein VgrG [Bacteroidia bacterium]|nr:type VI secretion system tip protein VgrG [Bacteroidia bacterium]